MVKSKKIKGDERKLALKRSQLRAQEKANHHIKNYQPVNSNWPTVEGGCYLRLSTDDQIIKGSDSILSQMEISIKEVKARSIKEQVNYKIVEFYIEKGVSGTKDDRPEYSRVKQDIKNDILKFVAMKETSRVARHMAEHMKFFDLAQKHNCYLMMPGFFIDPNDPHQTIQLSIIGVLNEHESKVISKRTSSSNLAALLSQGKENGTKVILGLDPLITEDQKRPGLYSPNNSELKVVNKIMKIFLRYRSFKKTLDICNEQNILNKNSTTFTSHTIRSLLSNTRYVGILYRNYKNKDKDQDHLADRDKFYEVNLPHGKVIDQKLWDQVQTVIKDIKGVKNRVSKKQRIYPLTGLLEFFDGSSLSGTSGTGRNKISYY